MKRADHRQLIATLLEPLAKWSSEWGVPGLERRVTVELSNRMRVTLGRARPSDKLIRINAALIDRPRPLLEEILCHEAAHIAVYELHRRRCRPHGPEWRDLMRIAGFEPRVRMALRPPLPSAHPKHLYEHQCPVCQVRVTARRPVRRWKCAACFGSGLSGDLIITKRPARSPD